jgi:hypothetical protein
MRSLSPVMMKDSPRTFLPRFCSTIARLGALTAKCGSALTMSAKRDSGVVASSSPSPSLSTVIEPMLLAWPSEATAHTT